MPKKLQKAIETKLDKLQELLDSLEEARNFDSNDHDTWDSDTFYSLVEDLKAALKLLQDQKTNQRNQSGELVIENFESCMRVKVKKPKRRLILPQLPLQNNHPKQRLKSRWACIPKQN